MKKLDLTGQRFGRLVAIRNSGKKQGGNYMWVCRCDCGKEVIVKADHLKRYDTQSCGCINKGRQKGIPKKHGGACNGVHDRLYGVWQAMRVRCEYKHHPHFKHYGGRGIKVCDEWRRDFETFRSWALANGYDENAPRGQCTLDRIDVNGNYEPSNCRWVDMKTQNNNKQRHKMKEAEYAH